MFPPPPSPAGVSVMCSPPPHTPCRCQCDVFPPPPPPCRCQCDVLPQRPTPSLQVTNFFTLDQGGATLEMRNLLFINLCQELYIPDPHSLPAGVFALSIFLYSIKNLM